MSMMTSQRDRSDTQQTATSITWLRLPHFPRRLCSDVQIPGPAASPCSSARSGGHSAAVVSRAWPRCEQRQGQLRRLVRATRPGGKSSKRNFQAFCSMRKFTTGDKSIKIQHLQEKKLMAHSTETRGSEASAGLLPQPVSSRGRAQSGA